MVFPLHFILLVPLISVFLRCAPPPFPPPDRVETHLLPHLSSLTWEPPFMQIHLVIFPSPNPPKSGGLLSNAR